MILIDRDDNQSMTLLSPWFLLLHVFMHEWQVSFLFGMLIPWYHEWRKA